MTRITISSPSKLGEASLLRPALAEISFAKPIVASSVVSSSAFAMVDTDTAATLSERCERLVKEGSLYTVATAYTPSWTEASHRDSNAKANAASLYGPQADVMVPQRIVLPWQCEPEVFVSTLSPQHSAFFAELKSVKATIFNQVMTYGVFALIKSFFSSSGRKSSTSVHRFYRKPLVGYGLVAFAHCGYFVALEWVGKLFMTPVRAQPDALAL